MRFSIFRDVRFSTRPRVDLSVGRDADELIQLWGNAAFERATDLSRQEDMGFASSPRPGHWWAVRREIARRYGHKDAEPMLEFAA